MRTLVSVLVIVTTFSILSAGAAFAQGPYGGGENLPEGVLALTLGGQGMSLVDAPTTSEIRPTISGKVDQSGGTIELGVASQAPQTATVSVGADGSFSHRVIHPLEPGKHEVFINGVYAGAFTIAAPGPPATGAGNSGSNEWALRLSVGAAVVLALAVAAGVGLSGRR